MKKHAYLIIAHNNFYVLKKELQLIDDERNDIYIHIDKKVKDFDFEKYKIICRKSKVYYVNKRFNCKWGDSSLVKAEMQLFSEAYKKGYAYYHLLSGSDLPIKSQDYIHDFFDRNRYEFIELAPGKHDIYEFRWGRYHFDQTMPFIKKAAPYLDIIQDRLKVNRINNLNMKIYKGSEWVSLSHNGVGLLIKNKNFIRKRTWLSLCSDEIYKQTLIFNSELAGSVYPKTDIRLIDWERHEGESPHTFTIDDYDMIKNSECLFARKFVEKVDRDIIDSVFELVTNKKGEN